MPTKTWQGRDVPKLSYIIDDNNPLLGTFLRSHLVLEGLLVTFIESRYAGDDLFRANNFPAKVQLCHNKGLFGDEFAAFLNKINDIRNRFAHYLGYSLSKNDVHSLIKEAGNVPEIEFTDDMHQLNESTLFEWYTNEEGALTEMFKHTAFDLYFLIESENIPPLNKFIG